MEAAAILPHGIPVQIRRNVADTNDRDRPALRLHGTRFMPSMGRKARARKKEAPVFHGPWALPEPLAANAAIPESTHMRERKSALPRGPRSAITALLRDGPGPYGTPWVALQGRPGSEPTTRAIP